MTMTVDHNITQFRQELPDRTLGFHLSLIHELQEEPELKEPRRCLFPPINPPPDQEKEKGMRAQLPFGEEHSRQEERRLLAELLRIEQELQERLRREKERQEVLELVRQEENRRKWRSLCYMGLNQRINKPWVFSFYKTIPMHIYCQPIQSNPHARRKKKSSSSG